MTDRIRAEFEAWVSAHPPTNNEPDLTFHMGRYARVSIRNMWSAWQAQAERVADMAAALERANNRQTGLLKQCHEIDARRDAAVALAAALADEVGRLNAIISRLSVEGQDAVEM